jgi:DNA-binding transcriptional ArsR family regulator
MIEPEQIPLVAKRFKVLGGPGRLALLAALQHGERNVSELAEATGRGQPNVSQHLRELVEAGLIAPRRLGNHVYYRIADPYVMRICDAVCRSLGASVPSLSRAGRAGRARSLPRVAAPGASRG